MPKVFGKALLHEFQISYSHSEWYFTSSRGELALLGQKLRISENIMMMIMPSFPTMGGKYMPLISFLCAILYVLNIIIIIIIIIIFSGGWMICIFLFKSILFYVN